MTDREAYEAAIRTKLEAQAFIDRKRCVSCSHNNRGTCLMHGSSIPDEYLYTPQDCDGYDLDIPF